MQTIYLQILVNPVAGNGKASKSFKKLKKLLVQNNIPYEYKVSNYPGELIQLAKQYGDQKHAESNRLVVIGGDGSLNEILNGIKLSNHPNTPISYLPAGSGNDFARAANLNSSPKYFLEQLQQNMAAKKVDCICYQDNTDEKKNYFVNNFGIGLDAFIVHRSNHQRLKKQMNKLHMGHFIYSMNILSALKNQDTFTIKIVEDGKISTYDNVYFATTTNHPYFGGGIAILPKANIYSHKLDLVIVQKPKFRKFIKLFAKLLKDGSHVTDPHFHYIETNSISIEAFESEYAQIDGEDQAKQIYKVKFRISSFYLQN